MVLKDNFRKHPLAIVLIPRNEKCIKTTERVQRKIQIVTYLGTSTFSSFCTTTLPVDTFPKGRTISFILYENLKIYFCFAKVEK